MFILYVFLGPLCAVCSDQYSLSSSTLECQSCSDSGGVDVVLIMFVVGIFVLLICVLLYYVTRKWNQEVYRKRVDDIVLKILLKIGIRDTLDSNYIQTPTSLRSKPLLKILSKRITARWKIYLTLWQIVSILPFTLNLRFPAAYTAAASALNILNLSLNYSGVVTCSSDVDYDAVDALVVDTIYPIIIAVVLWLACRIHMYLRKPVLIANIPSNSTSMSKIESTYFQLALIFSFIILPSLSTKLFQVFICSDIDPDDVANGNDIYMTVDYNVSCSSVKYKFGVLWAAAMIGVYPIGIPLCYYYLLSASKYDIAHRHSVSSSPQELLERRIRIQHLEILYGSYQSHLWWWELVETLHRLTLTGVLILIRQGSVIQVIVGIAISLLFLNLCDRFKPYTDKNLQAAKTLSHWQIFAVFELALLLKTDFDAVDGTTVGAFLIVAVFANVIVDIIRGVFILCASGDSGYDDTRQSEILQRHQRQELELKSGITQNGTVHGILDEECAAFFHLRDGVSKLSSSGDTVMDDVVHAETITCAASPMQSVVPNE